MWKFVLITASVLAAIKAEPQQFLVSAPLVASPYTSAYVGAPAQVVAAPLAYSAASVPTAIPAAVPAAVPAVPAAYPAYPYSSVSAYSYGSSYSIQDYLPVVNPAPASLAAYSLPYAYAADYYYRR